MLELIDQSNPDAIRYRCPTCLAEGFSSPSRASDEPGSFWTATPRGPTPGRWIQHVCEPADVKAADKLRAAQAAAIAAAQRGASDGEAAPVAKKRKVAVDT